VGFHTTVTRFRADATIRLEAAANLTFQWNGKERRGSPERLAMQKVEGSSPFIRF
jgi:hypothetical protein